MDKRALRGSVLVQGTLILEKNHNKNVPTIMIHAVIHP